MGIRELFGQKWAMLVAFYIRNKTQQALIYADKEFPLQVIIRTSLVAQMVKNLLQYGRPGFQVQSLGWEDPLEKGMETHSSMLAWRIPQTEEPGGLQPMDLQRVRHD